MSNPNISSCYLFFVFLIVLLFHPSVYSFKLNPSKIISQQPHQQLPVQLTLISITIISIYPQQKLSLNDYITIRGDNCNLTWTTGIRMNNNKKNNQKQIVLICPVNVVVNVKLLLNDKQWMMGANFQFRLTGATNNNNNNNNNNNILASELSLLTIYPSFHPSIIQPFDTAAIPSTFLSYPHKCTIYLPPSFNDNTLKPYPIIFLHDGQNLFYDSQSAFGTSWHIQSTLNTLITQGYIQQPIVIGIWNTIDRNNQYTYSYNSTYNFGGKGDKYVDFIMKQLQPIVKNKWFVNRITNKQGYTIGGSSLGGLISCYAMYTRPDFFKKAICMSTSFWWNNQDFNQKILNNSNYHYDNTTILYIDSGDAGTSQDGLNQTLTVKKSFIQMGYVENKNLYHYVDHGAIHNEKYWGQRFYIPMKKLFGNKVNVV